MNLSKLFEMQKALDDRIIKEHELEGQDLLPNLILSLQVELGELANEWQGFKHWKVNPQPKPKMLEEYVDCLHFILSLGNNLHHRGNYMMVILDKDGFDKRTTITDQFNMLFSCVGELWDYAEIEYTHFMASFIHLGEMLGFTWEQIETAYMDKNRINHERQDNGY